MINKGIQGYRRINVIFSDPKKLVIMCYEGTIENLKIGKENIIKKNDVAKDAALLKAQDIIWELINSLNFEKGGDIAKNLDSLYNYMLRRILYSAQTNDLNAIDEVVKMLEELMSAWKEIFYKKRDEAQSEALAYDKNRQSHSQEYLYA